MSDQPTVSAIVPTYNRASYLSNAVTAILDQTHAVSQLIVWDDGSTDHTPDVVKAFGDRVIYRRAANAGKSAALNAAMRLATGDDIWIVDDDDVPLPDACERLLRVMADRGTPIGAGSFERFSICEASGEKITSPPSYWPDLSTGSALRHILEECFLFQPGMLVHRSCYAQVGGFREDLPRSIDYDMLIRLALNSPIAITEDVVFEQREHLGNRGPAHSRHESDRMLQVWRENDQAIFTALAPKLPIDLFASMFAASNARARHRTALLQRACVWARHVLWDRAIEDLRDAAAVAPNDPLGKTEYAILRRAMSGKHFICSAIDGAAAERFAALRSTSPVGRDIAAGLVRGMAWRLRSAATNLDIGDLSDLTRTAVRIGGRQVLPLSSIAPQGTASVSEINPLPVAAACGAGKVQLCESEKPAKLVRPFVTIAMPALNERRYIRDAINSVLPEATELDCEVLVLDGGSIDDTRAIVEDMASSDPRIKLVENQRRIQASAINLAVKVADPRARYLVRADCHCTYPKDFVVKAIDTLQRTGAASVVVPMRTAGHTCMQRAIAAAQNSLLGNGGAPHRHIARSRFVDHGHHAAFAIRTFRETGGYDESFTHNEDAEFDYRLGKMGGRIYLDAELTVEYYPRVSLSKLARQYWNFGAGRAHNVMKHGETPRPRQLAPLMALGLVTFGFGSAMVVPAIALLPLSYLATCCLFGVVEALRNRRFCLLMAGPATIVMHQAWAGGFSWAVLNRVLNTVNGTIPTRTAS